MSDILIIESKVEAPTSTASSMTHIGHCLYCHKEVTNGELFHDGCDEDYVWQQKMKTLVGSLSVA